MNKLTPLFIAGSLAISAGLVIAQNQMVKDDPIQGHDMPGMDMSDMRAPASGNPFEKAGIGLGDRTRWT